MFSKKNKGVYALILTLFFMVSFLSNAQDGEALFNSKCATCHSPHKDMTGPKLFEIRQQWDDGGAKSGSIHKWVRNWQVAAAEDPYAAKLVDWSPTAMSTFPSMTDEEIDAIFDFVDVQPLPGSGGGSGAGVGGGASSGDGGGGGLYWWWYVIGAVSLAAIFIYASMAKQLKSIKELTGNQTESEIAASRKDTNMKLWAWNNKKYIGIAGFIVVVSAVTWLFLGLNTVGVVSGYQPSQPIAFPHDIHAGLNGIDCMYCHNSANKSRTAGLPTTNVCMNCHKQIHGEGAQVEKIANIHKSAGFTPGAGGGAYDQDRSNIVWNKVHNLPDYVYFSHQQHVVVGGVDCKQCHGDMTKQHETARVVPVEELNLIEGNIQLTKPTLTMGWCIECHDKKEVSSGQLNTEGGYYEEIHKRLQENDPELYAKYLEDGKVTVRELGGWECAKCHY